MIKHVCLTLAVALLCVSSLSAQSPAKKFLGANEKWQVKRVGISLGVDQDMLSSVDHNYFTSLLDAQTQARYAGISYDEQYKYAGICENPHVRLSLSLIPTMMKNTEVNLALNGIFFRNDGVSYHNDSWYYGEGDYLSFDVWGHEVNGEFSIVKSKTVLNSFRFFGGLGTNLGYTFGNTLNVNSSDFRTVLDYSLLETGQIVSPMQDDRRIDFSGMEYFDYYEDHKINDGISQRLFAHAGVSFLLLRKLELGFEGRLGYGYRYHFGRNIVGARLQSFGITAKWVLGEASPWLRKSAI